MREEVNISEELKEILHFKIDKNKEQGFSFQYYRSARILYKHYYGKVNLDDIISSWQYAILNKLIPCETRGIIMDYRLAEISLTHKELYEIPKFYYQYPEYFKGVKMAVVTENPRDVTIPILVKEMEQGYLFQPFATIDSALHWVFY